MPEGNNWRLNTTERDSKEAAMGLETWKKMISSLTTEKQGQKQTRRRRSADGKHTGESEYRCLLEDRLWKTSEAMVAEVPRVRGEGHRMFLCCGSDPGERGDAGDRIFKGEK